MLRNIIALMSVFVGIKNIRPVKINEIFMIFANYFLASRYRRMLMTKLNINGKNYDIDVEPDTPLLWVIREQVGLTGTKYGCGIGQCGACTILFEGQALRSCVLPVAAAEGKKIETIESLEKNGQLSKIQKAWVDHQVPQCGYCQSGMVMATTALLRNTPKPTDVDIDLAVSNICRCGTFQQVREAIHAVSKT